MSTISEIKQRAKALAEKTDVNSVTPKEVGGIMYDLGSYGEHIMRNGGTLGIRKVYASIEDMEADNTNPVDLWGDPIKKGNLVVIYDGANGEHNNEVYAFLNPGWKLATNFDAGYAMKADVDAKLSELGSKVNTEVLGEIGYKEQASGNVQITGLNIKEGTNIRVVVDNGEREYQYFSIVIIEDGETKTIAKGITQIGGVYSIDYRTEGVVSLVVVQYTNTTNQSIASLKILNLDSLENKIKKVEKEIEEVSITLSGEIERAISSEESIGKNVDELRKEVNGYIAYKESETGNITISDLSIKENSNLRFVVNNNNRTYTYFSIVIIEGGDAKTIKSGVTQQGGEYSFDYASVAEITRVQIVYSNITTDDVASLKIVSKDSIETSIENHDKRISQSEAKIEKLELSVKGKSMFVEEVGGIKELYLFDESVAIQTLHLLYNGGSSNRYSVVFFNEGSQVARTEERTSSYNGILKIFDSSTLGSTDVVIGYIIVDWSAFATGTNTVVKNILPTCYDLNLSPIICNYIQNLKRWGIEKEVWKPIKREMFDDLTTLKATLDNEFVKYAELCHCSHYSFYFFDSLPADMKYLKPLFNLNFRRKVIYDEMTTSEMAAAINYAFTQPIERFNDAKLYSVNKDTDMGWSIDTGMPVGEPSAIVSDDGGTLYVYCGALYRYKSTDGINYIKDADITLDGVHWPMGSAEYLMHCNVNYINGVYYLIGTHANYNPLVLWTSTDGVDFTKRGTLMTIGEIINEKGDAVNNFGNTFLLHEGGKWYLYYEITYLGAKSWCNCLAICDDILEKEADGTLGVWNQVSTNPIQDAAITYPLQATQGYGNIDFARGENNLPIKYNGKYYMYYHSSSNRGSLLCRGYSADLVNWTQEQMLYNNRDVPTAGALAPGNADHTIIQFKGRTLLFYTYDINDPNNEPVVKLMIDDRPIRELLALMP